MYSIRKWICEKGEHITTPYSEALIIYDGINIKERLAESEHEVLIDRIFFYQSPFSVLWRSQLLSRDKACKSSIIVRALHLVTAVILVDPCYEAKNEPGEQILLSGLRI